MVALAADQISQAVGGEILVGDSQREASSVSTDTRSVSAGQLFVALAGENFDAHDYLDQVVTADAAAMLVSHLPEGLALGDVAAIRVDDTLVGLQKLAQWHRQELVTPVVAITGSNGKTSTKDFTRSVLAEKFSVNATKGNLNNHIGVPLSILATTTEHNCCVFEMGMNHPGEIAPLCQMAQPTIGIITNVGTAHIEYMGSREAIAEEKGELARSLPADATLFIPADCDFSDQFESMTQAKVVRVGGKDSTIRAVDVKMGKLGSTFTLVIEESGEAEVSLPVTGQHMVTNALLAAGAGQALGLSVGQIAKGLSETELTSGRLRAFESDGVMVFDDTYNANPESMAAAIETVADMSLADRAQRIVVLGKMGELGDHAEAAYVRLGALTATRGLKLISVGDEANSLFVSAIGAGGEAVHFSEIEDAAAHLKSIIRSGDAVLFKGSRLAGMERVMNKVFPE